MIISHQHRFVFLHNPKAGGTSVRRAIEPLNDIGFGLWGGNPQQTQGVPVDRAHLGIDEFAHYYPEIWDRAQHYALFCLVRDPQRRFLSSMSEHCKNFGEQDLRFALPQEGRDIVMRVLDKLEPLERAEAVTDDRTLTHFKPQHLYWHSERFDVSVQTFATQQIDALVATLSERAGTPLSVGREKSAQTYRLPPALRVLRNAKGLRRALRQVPGLGALMDFGRDSVLPQYATGKGRDLALSEADRTRITDFVTRFYARDYALWPVSLPLERSRDAP